MAARRPYDHLKRGLDILVGGAAFLISLPFQCAIAIMVARRLGRPVLFRQERPGLDGKIFKVVKFRSMLPVSPEHGQVTDGARLTPFGAKLRATSLDELPSLWNVVKGEMSLVGPRPLLPGYLPLYDATQMRRHEVRPGVTGYAQVRGRNALSWDEKFALDIEYVDRRSFQLDVRILLATAWTVISRSGITADGDVTMPPFTGASAAGNETEQA